MWRARTEILGSGEGGTPSAATLRGANAGGSNVAGANLTIQAGTGTGTGGSGAILFQTGAAGAGVALDTGTYTTSGLASSKTFSFTVGANANRLLIVDVAVPTYTVSSVTYGGVSMTQLYANVVSGTQHSVYYLAAPATGANNVVVNFSNTVSSAIIGVTSLYNVSQSGPVGTTTSNHGTTGSSDSEVISSGTGSYGFDSFMENSVTAPSVGASQSSTYGNGNNGIGNFMFGSTKAGAASVTMSATFGAAMAYWDHVAFSVNTTSGTGSGSRAGRRIPPFRALAARTAPIRRSRRCSVPSPPM